MFRVAVLATSWHDWLLWNVITYKEHVCQEERTSWITRDDPFRNTLGLSLFSCVFALIVAGTFVFGCRWWKNNLATCKKRSSSTCCLLWWCQSNVIRLKACSSAMPMYVYTAIMLEELHTYTIPIGTAGNKVLHLAYSYERRILCKEVYDCILILQNTSL